MSIVFYFNEAGIFNGISNGNIKIYLAIKNYLYMRLKSWKVHFSDSCLNKIILTNLTISYMYACAG